MDMNNEKGAVAILVIITILMFVIILMGTYSSITNLRKAQLESDIRIQQLYGGDVENIEEIYRTIINKVQKPISELKLGDYIKYDSGANGEILCRVLYTASSPYGLQIVSDKNVKSITLGGKNWSDASISYNNAIETLNKEAEGYINQSYAIDARCIGSIPTTQNGKFIDKNRETQTTVVLPLENWQNYVRPNDWDSDDTKCFNTDTNYITDEEQMKALNIWKNGGEYYLASRKVETNSSECYFIIRYVQNNGEIGSYDVCSLNSKGETFGIFREHELRLCISLKENIKIIQGDGKTEATAYKIGY